MKLPRSGYSPIMVLFNLCHRDTTSSFVTGITINNTRYRNKKIMARRKVLKYTKYRGQGYKLLYCCSSIELQVSHFLVCQARERSKKKDKNTDKPIRPYIFLVHTTGPLLDRNKHGVCTYVRKYVASYRSIVASSCSYRIRASGSARAATIKCIF